MEQNYNPENNVLPVNERCKHFTSPQVNLHSELRTWSKNENANKQKDRRCRLVPKKGFLVYKKTIQLFCENILIKYTFNLSFPSLNTFLITMSSASTRGSATTCIVALSFQYAVTPSSQKPNVRSTPEVTSAARRRSLRSGVRQSRRLGLHVVRLVSPQHDWWQRGHCYTTSIFKK